MVKEVLKVVLEDVRMLGSIFLIGFIILCVLIQVDEVLTWLSQIL